MKIYLFLISLIVLISCTKETDIKVEDSETSKNPNILLIIADDMGLDACPRYDIGTIKPHMPNLEKLMSNGIRFNNLWSAPVCTPTRATIITGKYGFNTSVMKVDDVLAESETSLQKYIDTNTGGKYSNAVIGKWHLSRDEEHPLNLGIDYYAGSLNGGLPSYFEYQLIENRQSKTCLEYATSKYTDLAIDWIANQTDPWFLWLAYNAPHSPFHLPPDNLHFQGSLPTDQASIDADPLPYYMAMIEAMDTEIGRLLGSLSQEEIDNTIIIFIGDNGTPGKVAQEHHSRRAKGSIYQGGINVPMIISGKGVSRINETEDALINTTDLFATIAEIADNKTTKIHDSYSFKGLLSDNNAPKREYAYSEIGYETEPSTYAIRNATHKYILFNDGSEALYNLQSTFIDKINLLSENQLPLSPNNEAINDDLMVKAKEIRNE
ncbi:sulfatase [Labilibacter sediminis]|nr:sulfatase [Labilibacter sediminis]